MRISEKEFQQLLQRSPAHIASQYSCIPQPKREAKYRNQKVYVYKDGFVSYAVKAAGRGKPVMVFDSIKEYNRWNELKLLARSGKITRLERQVEFLIQEAQTMEEGRLIRKIAYKADFVYRDANGLDIVEDVKPFDTKTEKYRTTKDFDIKWKLLQAKYTTYRFRLY